MLRGAAAPSHPLPIRDHAERCKAPTLPAGTGATAMHLESAPERHRGPTVESNDGHERTLAAQTGHCNICATEINKRVPSSFVCIDAGQRVVLNSDDSPMLRTDLRQEFVKRFR